MSSVCNRRRHWPECVGRVNGTFCFTGVSLLCGTTAAELYNSVDLLCDTTLAELHNSVNLLCGTTAAELNPFWYMHQESQTFSEDIDEPCWKICRLNPKRNLTANFWKMNALDDSANTDQCTLYEDSANFLKDERFTKTEYQTSANLWMMNAEDTKITTWVSASKWGKT